MSPYERVASEYYDERLHPTCANLRRASDVGLAHVLAEGCAARERYLELGAGASSFSTLDMVNASMVCVDLNLGMLRNVPSDAGAVVADATKLPFDSDSFIGAVGSLIDPFNTPDLYVEARRVLTPGGRLVFTVPDVRWTRANQIADSLPPHTAGITLSDGSVVLLPSYVWDFSDQAEMLVAAGFADVRRYDVPIEALGDGTISRRFLGEDGLPAFPFVVSVYQATCA